MGRLVAFGPFFLLRSSISLGLVTALAAVSGGVAVGCSGSSSSSSSGTTNVPECTSVAVDRFKELEIVDDEVVGDARSLNASDGPWSFRHVFEQLAGQQTASDFIQHWLASWTQQAMVNLYPVAARTGVGPQLLCPWLKLSPDNQCNDDCSTCTNKVLDMGKAPFKLIGIINRIDLVNSDQDPEARFVFGLMDGPADDPNSKPKQMSLITEFHLDTSTQSAKQWAQRWHQLGSFAKQDESYKAALQAITDDFSKSKNLQVRTNERVFDWQWQLREYKYDGTGLSITGTANTPDSTVNSSDQLNQWLQDNRDAVMKNKHHLPPRLLGGGAEIEFNWVAQVDEPLRHAFAQQTCNGCHHTEMKNPLDINFQLSPMRTGRDRLSTFLHNPADTAHDELHARESQMCTLLTTP